MKQVDQMAILGGYIRLYPNGRELNHGFWLQLLQPLLWKTYYRGRPVVLDLFIHDLHTLLVSQNLMKIPTRNSYLAGEFLSK